MRCHAGGSPSTIICQERNLVKHDLRDCLLPKAPREVAITVAPAVVSLRKARKAPPSEFRSFEHTHSTHHQSNITMTKNGDAGESSITRARVSTILKTCTTPPPDSPFIIPGKTELQLSLQMPIQKWLQLVDAENTRPPQPPQPQPPQPQPPQPIAPPCEEHHLESYIGLMSNIMVLVFVYVYGVPQSDAKLHCIILPKLTTLKSGPGVLLRPWTLF